MTAASPRRKMPGPQRRDFAALVRHVDKLEQALRAWTKYGARIPKKPPAYLRAIGAPVPPTGTKPTAPLPSAAEPRPVNPLRIQRQRSKGWRAPEGAVYVGRPTCWGNPYERDDLGSSDLLIAMYRDWIKSDSRAAAIARKRLPELRGKVLSCWCPADQPCHADVLIELANPKCEAATS